MELASQGDLRRLLSDVSERLNWGQKIKMLRDRAMGLSFLHSRGIVHPDIQSSNLLVESDYSVRVGDFGFATAKQDDGTQMCCGTMKRLRTYIYSHVLIVICLVHSPRDHKWRGKVF